MCEQFLIIKTYWSELQRKSEPTDVKLQTLEDEQRGVKGKERENTHRGRGWSMRAHKAETELYD